MKLSVLERVLLATLLLMLVMVGLGACAAPSQAGSNVEDKYVVFEKTLPSGKVVECVGWVFAHDPSSKGAAIECFPK